MKARFFCTTGIFAGAKFEFTKEATIGKHKDNGIVLAPPIISNRHARIYFDDQAQCYFLEDLGSRNGTLVDGVRVKKKEKLAALNIITLAQKFDFIFQVLDNHERDPAEKQPAQSQSPESPHHTPGPPTEPVLAKEETVEVDSVSAPFNGKTMLESEAPVRVVPAEKTSPARNGRTLVEAMALGKKLAANQPVFLLEFSSKGRRFKTVELKSGENFLGRTAPCEIEIDDPSISRRHAVVTVSAGKVFVKDLGSRNHTFVGKQTILTEAEIQLDTALRFGHVEAQLIRRVADKASRLGHLV
jgi:pSer/pThr/pTyr-binding forkhead associated (FHA) protein